MSRSCEIYRDAESSAMPERLIAYAFVTTPTELISIFQSYPIQTVSKADTGTENLVSE
jgi:hypothetical protein